MGRIRGQLERKVKLTPTQQRVVDLMEQGWELGCSMTIDGKPWIQQGGLGKGGKTEKVSIATLDGLLKKKVIQMAYRRFPTTAYCLAEM